jgi:hypothetical protein
MALSGPLDRIVFRHVGERTTIVSVVGTKYTDQEKCRLKQKSTNRGDRHLQTQDFIVGLDHRAGAGKPFRLGS